MELHPPAPHYVGKGIIIGIIVATALLGTLFYRNKVNEIASVNMRIKNEVISQQKIQVIPTLSIEPTSMPISIQSKQDLSFQQTALDNADLSAFSSSLDQNAQDVAHIDQQ